MNGEVKFVKIQKIGWSGRGGGSVFFRGSGWGGGGVRMDVNEESKFL